MKFKPFVAINGDFATMLLKRDQERLRKAATIKGPAGEVHRKFARDVMTVFAMKAELDFSMAVQLFHLGNVQAAPRLWTTIAQRHPMEILDPGNPRMKIANPVRRRYMDLAAMPPKDVAAFIHEAINHAITVRHPNDPVPHGFNRDRERDTANKTLATRDTQVVQMVGKTIIELARVKATERLKRLTETA